jgi:hypothetical protein
MGLQLMANTSAGIDDLLLVEDIGLTAVVVHF